ncbi:hypothetical protein [Aggregatilinea lenta]|uniref:hypothetical protein n=1 Tax=Aggregatilinea lenta TaxID=913108 RepID=UPI000E5B92D2|nr:hypothetical protein [Aggregatilinea lenta]
MSDNLDELRRRALEEEEVVESYEVFAAPEEPPEHIFGMTAVERMFVSIGCFLVVSLSGFLLLLVLDKIALP